MTKEDFHKQHTRPAVVDLQQDPPIPEKIGPYKIEALLNKGSMSWLYMGLDTEKKTPVAIKVLPAHLIDNPETLDRFLQESQLTALTNHPHIVKLYQEGKWEGGVYIAMEWVHGVSLRQFITQQSFSLKRSLEIILQICEALKHLHDHHIIHKDLKPENVLITEEGVIKVIDFGIAQMVHNTPLLISSKIVGTPNYMSPEQKKDPSHVSYSSDIYSLGVLAYELLLGKLSHGVIQTSLLPKNLRHIIEKTLAISVQNRYAKMEDLIHDVSSYLHSEAFEQEKPQEDRSTELLEQLQKLSLQLSPVEAPSYPYADIGIAKLKSPHSLGLYYDLFPLPDGKYLFIIIDPLEQHIEALFQATALRSSIHTLLSQQPPSSPLSFVQQIQKHLPQESSIALSYLYLEPAQNTLRFFNAGLSQLLYIPAGQESRILYHAHPLFSCVSSVEWTDTQETWNVGDTLIYHNFISEEKDPSEKKQAMEQALKKLAQKELLLSAQSQAEAFIKDLSRFPALHSDKNHVLISIQRTA